MGIVPMHNWKMPLKYWGMLPSQSWPRTSWSGGRYLRIGGKKIYLGIQYILHRNSTEGTTAKLIL